MEAKFKLGEAVRDNFTGRDGIVSVVDFDEKEQTWYYSIDRMGWKFLPESDLESMETKGD